jgi:hypothetical protein
MTRTLLLTALLGLPVFGAQILAPFELSASSPFFNRPFSDGLSVSSVSVPYATVNFALELDSDIRLSLYAADGASISPAGANTLLFLYEGTFDPNNPLTNLIAFNDDVAPDVLSRLSNIPLVSDTPYIAVVTAYTNNGDPNNLFPWTGNLRISGDGLRDREIPSGRSQVPEPSTWLMATAGLGLLLLRRAQR